MQRHAHQAMHIICQYLSNMFVKSIFADLVDLVLSKLEPNEQKSGSLPADLIMVKSVHWS